MAWRNGRSSITGGALGQVVQTSVRNSLGRVSPTRREGAGLNDPWGLFQLLSSAFSGKLVEGNRGRTTSSGGCLWAVPVPRTAGASGGLSQGSAWCPRHIEPCGSPLPCGHSRQLRMPCLSLWGHLSALLVCPWSLGNEPLPKVSSSGFPCHLRDLRSRADVPKAVSSVATGFFVQRGHCRNVS